MTTTAQKRAHLMAFAAGRHGIFTRRDAAERGLDHRRLTTGVRAGDWVPGPADTFVLAGFGGSRRFDIALAVASAGELAMAGFRTALELHGVTAETTKPEVLVPHGRRLRLEAATTHQTRRFAERVAGNRYGIRCALPEDALIDCAATMTRTRLSHALDECLAASIVEIEQLSRTFASAVRQNRRGLAKMAKVLDEFSPGPGASVSSLEALAHRWYRRSGLSPTRTQSALPSLTRPDSLVDAVFLREKVINEIDGRRWHSRVADRKRDADRDWEAAKHGFVTVRTLAEHLNSDPEDVMRDLHDVLEMRRRQLGPSGG